MNVYVLEELYSERRAAEILGVAFETLGSLRRKGEGPPFHRITKGGVRYLRSELITWIRERDNAAVNKSESGEKDGANDV